MLLSQTLELELEKDFSVLCTLSLSQSQNDPELKELVSVNVFKSDIKAVKKDSTILWPNVESHMACGQRAP